MGATRALLALLSIGCASPTPLPGDGLLAPLEVINLAPPVPADGNEPFPEALTWVAGFDADADRYWAHARGWIHTDLLTAWAASRSGEVMADRREVDSYTVDTDVDPGFPYSFDVHSTVRQIIRVQFTQRWLHVGDDDGVLIRWDKIDGTGFIELLSGSVLLRPDDDGRTSIELIQHMRAAQRDEATLVQYLQDLHADLVATAHGRPLPAYD